MVFKKLKDKYKYDYLYYYNKIFPRLRLKTLNIEFTSYCNLKCKWCILDNSRPKGFMHPYLLKKIFKEIKGWRYNIKEIILCNAGETFLHPKFKDLIAIIKKNKKKNSPKITIITNATILNEEKTKPLLDDNVIDLIWFSIDGGNKKEYEIIRKTNWDKIIEDVQSFINIKKSKKTNLQTGVLCLISSEQKQNVSEDFKKIMGKDLKTKDFFSIIKRQKIFSEDFLKLLEDTDYFSFRSPDNWDGSKEMGLEKNKKFGFCDFILTNLAILWDGRVSPCCNDLNARGVIGDLNKESLYKIYKSKKRKKMIELMKKRCRKDIFLCKNCDK